MGEGLLDAPPVEYEEGIVPLELFREIGVLGHAELFVQCGDGPSGLAFVEGRTHGQCAGGVPPAAGEGIGNEDDSEEERDHGQRRALVT